jgi:hypothetical protein
MADSEPWAERRQSVPLPGGEEGKYKEMLKMKVDPTMSMKTLETQPIVSLTFG